MLAAESTELFVGPTDALRQIVRITHTGLAATEVRIEGDGLSGTGVVADLAMTPECFVGADVESIAWGDAQCANAFGVGWKWLEFHHDGGWESAGKWRDAVGVGERGWVNINDQAAECFESVSGHGLTWIRESEDSTSACAPGVGLEGPEFQPHAGACNPYGGDTPCSMCRRLVCSAG